MPRIDGRKATELRPTQIIRGYTKSPAGSVLIKTGETAVLCTASWEVGAPDWKRGMGSGWVTAEYDMLPGATAQRRRRNRSKIDGRTQEIQRLIGRSLRAVVDLEALGENSILLDCDVLQADGGTRTAAITGAYVALRDAVRVARKSGWLENDPVRGGVAATSVGMVDGKILVDLNYLEDVAAAVDMNVVMTASGQFVEVQGTGEEATFSRDELSKMLDQASKAIKKLHDAQEQALRKRIKAGI